MNQSAEAGRVAQPLSLAAGRVLDNVTLHNTRIDGRTGFSGLLADDCLYRDLKISANLVLLHEAAHLELSGVLSGGEFCANRLSLLGEAPLTIRLAPGKVGCNIADDGLLYILSFKASSACEYAPFIVADNCLHASDAPVAIKINDARTVIPAQFGHCAAGLVNFDHETFYRQYSGWTVRDFQARDSAGYRRLADWLERREEEYRSGERIDAVLPPPTASQRSLGANTSIDMLAQARKAMARNQADFRALRLNELPYVPLRSFMLKRLALRNAELAPLADLGEQNAYRQAQLQWLLPERACAPLADKQSAWDAAYG